MYHSDRKPFCRRTVSIESPRSMLMHYTNYFSMNLQCANHVIFVSSLIKSSKEAWHATMTQAIGRVKRFGQKKTVQVWYLLASNTIDVNVLQERRNAVLRHVQESDGSQSVSLVPQYDTDGRQMTTMGFEGDFSGAFIDSSFLEIGDLASD